MDHALRLKSKKQYPGYKITQYNLIMDVLEGYLEEVRESVQSLVEDRNKVVLKEDTESHANKYSKHCKKYEDVKEVLYEVRCLNQLKT